MVRAIYTVTPVFTASYLRSLRGKGVLFGVLSQTIYAHLSLYKLVPSDKSCISVGHMEYWNWWFHHSLPEIVPAVQFGPFRATFTGAPRTFYISGPYFLGSFMGQNVCYTVSAASFKTTRLGSNIQVHTGKMEHFQIIGNI